MDKFHGKVAIVTGSTSGIGRETALHFARLGVNVIVNGRRSELVEQISKECETVAPNGIKCVGVVADVTIEEQAKRIVDTAIEQFGKVDILVNNAGIMLFSSIFDANIMENYKKVMDTNLTAVLYLCHLVAPHLQKTKGCIVNVASVGSWRPSSLLALYNMSKAAVNMLTKCLALDLGSKGIRVNCVNPSNVTTNLIRGAFPFTPAQLEEHDAKTAKQLPLRRVGKPIDVAKAIAFLASDDASFTTGESMLVDGGAIWGINVNAAQDE